MVPCNKHESCAWIKFLLIPHFKMDTPRGSCKSLRRGLWAFSLNLQDTYFRIPFWYPYLLCHGSVGEVCFSHIWQNMWLIKSWWSMITSVFTEITGLREYSSHQSIIKTTHVASSLSRRTCMGPSTTKGLKTTKSWSLGLGAGWWFTMEIKVDNPQASTGCILWTDT